MAPTAVSSAQSTLARTRCEFDALSCLYTPRQSSGADLLPTLRSRAIVTRPTEPGARSRRCGPFISTAEGTPRLTCCCSHAHLPSLRSQTSSLRRSCRSGVCARSSSYTTSAGTRTSVSAFELYPLRYFGNVAPADVVLSALDPLGRSLASMTSTSSRTRERARSTRSTCTRS